MRYDNIGMFWEDRPVKNKREAVVRPMPEIPDTGWQTPAELPDLTRATAYAIDVETKDPELLENGPGWARGIGHIIGLSVAIPNGPGWYFPIRHEIEPEYNMDPETVLRWADYHLKGNQPKIGANLLYDIGWLTEEGVRVGGPLFDVQFAEALLDSEAPDIDLDSLAAKYLNAGKQTSVLYQWCADFYGGNVSGKQRKNIYRSPPRLAGPYGEADAILPMRILERQWAAMEQRGVLDLFNMECGLIRLLIAMRRKGAPVDVAAAERMHERLGKEMDELSGRMKHLTGQEVNPNASASIAKAFDALDLPIIAKTAKGTPSFTADILEKIEHPLPQLILEHRKKSKLRSTFIESYILNSHINGRVHCQFHPLKGDENGARSGRFASSDPNLQNIPVRSEEGRLIRNIFVSTAGRWRKFDYSQIEYRLLAHHAVGPGADDIRARYNLDPKTDYHEATAELIKMLTGIEMNRRSTKTINFGLIYGMGKTELIRRLGLARKEGYSLFDAYHKAVPFAKATADAASDEAQQTGLVRTILGRCSDFNQWGPAYYDEDAKGMSFESALKTYGAIQRLFTHKALNRRLQGGAADIMKKAMVQCYEAGVFDATGIPLLTVHDELDFDDENNNEEAFSEMKHIMQTCVEGISVPIVVDQDIGARWGDCG